MRWSLLGRMAVLGIIAVGAARVSLGATITVTTTADSGAGSLRAALLAAAAGDSIAFSIVPNNVVPLFPLPTYPSIALTSGSLMLTTNNVTIDGTTQPTTGQPAGQPAAALVELDGAGLPANAAGLVIAATGCTIKGLVINRCPGHGIDVQGVAGVGTNTIVGNLIGTNVFGDGALNNGFDNNGDGIHVTCSGNTIGGTTAATRNLLSGNVGAGVELTGATATGNTVQGNYCGLGGSGASAIGNFDGINVNTGATGNTIGGTAAGAGNVCSGNAHDGIHLVSSNNTLVQGNFVGVDATGKVIVTNNAIFGIEVSGCTGTLVGGTVAGARNVVGGNAAGIELDAGSSNNTVQGNFSGVGADGVSQVGNRLHGIVMRDPAVQNNLIGGTVAGAGNTVMFNGTAGIAVFNTAADPTFSTGNAILGNSIYLNGRSNPTFLLGIDLVILKPFPTDDGNTPNHNPIASTGPNNFQNFPVLTSAIPVAAGGTTITGTLFAAASKTFRIEFFASPTASQSGFGEGQTFLGFASVTTDATGNASFTANVAGSATGGQFVSATATDPNNNTSEFSAALGVTPPPSISSALTANGTINAAFTYTITTTGGTPSAFTATGLPGGLSISGATISGTPTQVGTFPVTIGASNTSGADSKTLMLIIAPLSSSAASNTLQDSDGDGFPDELEKFLNTDPFNAASTPFGGAPAGTPVAISSPKLTIKLNFGGGGSDSISFSGQFTVPSGTSAASKSLTTDIGGVLNTFTLGSKGSTKQGNTSAKVLIKGTTAKFTITLTKGAFAASFSDEGLTSAGATKASKMVPIDLLFNQTLYQVIVTQSYTSKNNKGTFSH